MAWCPKCKNEYREGIKVCAECGCELVEENINYNKKPLCFGEEKMLLSLKGFLEYNDMRDVTIEFDEGESEYQLYVKAEDLQRAQNIARVFLEQQALDKLKEAQNAGIDTEYPEADCEEEENTCQNDRQITTPYVNSAEQAEDNRSSAWVLLFVGSVGLIAMIMGIMGIIPFRLGNPYMFYGVMSAVFILFIVMGAVSMKNAKIFEKKAESENTLRDSLLKWCEENLTSQKVDEQISDIAEMPDELLYFNRYEIIKKMMNHQFMNLDQGFLEKLIDDEVYDMVFENKEV